MLAAAAESRGKLDLATAVELAHKRQQNVVAGDPKVEIRHVVATSNQLQSLGTNEITNLAPKPVEWSEVGTAPSFSRRSLATLKNHNATSRRKRLECEACDFKCLTKQVRGVSYSQVPNNSCTRIVVAMSQPAKI